MSLRADEEWARRIFLLHTSINGSILRLFGRVSFRAHYTGSVLVYDKSIPLTVLPENIVSDSWTILFIHDYSGQSVPKVFDASDRIKRTQTQRKVNSLGMHLNDRPPRSFCVAPISELTQAFSKGFDLERYFYQYLIPFLFQQSYFEEKGIWPWPNYPHGSLGDRLWQMKQK